MKFIVWIFSAFNIYQGMYFLLNVFNILKSSKYSQTATVVFAILFLGMGLAGFYLSIFKGQNKLALLTCAGPWLLALVFLLFNMLTGDYK